MTAQARERTVVFIDGANWYHSLRTISVARSDRLNYVAVSAKLAGNSREWIATRYYAGQVHPHEAPHLHRAQRQFLARLAAADSRITYHLGRLETRPVSNDAALELRRYLAGLRVRIDPTVYAALWSIAERHMSVRVTVEKAVDVMLSVDMAMMAHRDEFDSAFLLSADGDYTPAVAAVRQLGKRVHVVSPARSAQLRRAADSYMMLEREWFSDCW